MNTHSILNIPRRPLLLLAALLTASALAACGRDTPAPQAASETSKDGNIASQINNLGLGTPAGFNRNPCEYMKREDAELAVGLPLPKTTEIIPLGMCDYMTAEFYGASLTVGDWEGVKGAATSGGAKRPPTVISGVGDEALNLNGSNGSNLYVRKGDRGFLLTLSGPNVDGLPDHGLEREKVLALKILPGL